jgi:DUF1365 family protein
VTVSGIYTGTVRHRRYDVVERQFSHELNFAYLDLAELDSLAGGRLVRRLPGPWRFRRRDYLAPTALPLDVAVRDLVERETGQRPSGPVRLLTQLRSFGMAFNPVTFYYCFTANGDQVHSVVAQVTNTPWRERHAYVLGPFSGGRVLRSTTPKAMHVSLFMGMAQRYEISMTAPDQTLSAHIACVGVANTEFDATLSLRRAADLTGPALAQLIRRDPVAPLRTLKRIYAQGFKLHRAGVSVHPHPTLTTPTATRGPA